MTGGERPVLHQLQNGRAEAQQAQRVCDRGAGFAHAGRSLLLRHFIGAHQLLIAEGFFNRVEIRALQIFNQRQLHRFFVVGFDHHDRHIGEASQSRGAPTALACDDLIEPGRQPAYRQRLDNAVHPDGIRQGIQLFRVEGFARLKRIRFDFLQRQRYCTLAGRVRLLVIVPNQGAKALAKTLSHCHMRCSSHCSFARISCATAS